MKQCPPSRSVLRSIYLGSFALIQSSSVDNDTPIDMRKLSNQIDGRAKYLYFYPTRCLGLSLQLIKLNLVESWRNFETMKRSEMARVNWINIHPCSMIFKRVSSRTKRTVIGEKFCTWTHLIISLLLIHLEKDFPSHLTISTGNVVAAVAGCCSCKRSRRKNLFCPEHLACLSVGNSIHICSIAFAAHLVLFLFQSKRFLQCFAPADFLGQLIEYPTNLDNVITRSTLLPFTSTNIARANQIFPTNELDIQEERCRTSASAKARPRPNQRWSIVILIEQKNNQWSISLGIDVARRTFGSIPQTLLEHRVSHKEALVSTNIGLGQKQSSPRTNPPRDNGKGFSQFHNSCAFFSIVRSDRCTFKGKILWQMRFRSTWCSALLSIDRKSSERNYNNL